MSGGWPVWTAEAVLVCALTLLGRAESSFPPIRFVDHLPADVSCPRSGTWSTRPPRATPSAAGARDGHAVS